MAWTSAPTFQSKIQTFSFVTGLIGMASTYAMPYAVTVDSMLPTVLTCCLSSSVLEVARLQ